MQDFFHPQIYWVHLRQVKVSEIYIHEIQSSGKASKHRNFLSMIIMGYITRLVWQKNGDGFINGLVYGKIYRKQFFFVLLKLSNNKGRLLILISSSYCSFVPEQYNTIHGASKPPMVVVCLCTFANAIFESNSIQKKASYLWVILTHLRI